MNTSQESLVSSKKGSVFGGILLITGSCVGAGMLGIPILTGLVGFFPSLFLLCFTAFFMTATGLLMVEVDQWFSHETNFISMTDKMLGSWGRIVCWVLYLFLFYALLMAYIAASGQHLSSFLSEASVTPWMGSLFFVLFFGVFVYLGTRPVDFLNRVLMAGKVITYVLLIVTGFFLIKPHLLEYVNLRFFLLPIPILITSFGFQNMIPTLSHYLQRDVKRIKLSIIGGALFVLFFYVFWQVVALGSLPIEGENGILSSYHKGVDAAQAIQRYFSSPWIETTSTFLAFFAILTSFLAQALTLTHFLADGIKIRRKTKREPISMCLLALLPPLVLAMINPAIFYKALNFAGGFCAVILFGILPVLMVYNGRYRRRLSSPYKVRGGMGLLLFLFLMACFILFYQFSDMIGLHLFPTPA